MFIIQLALNAGPLPETEYIYTEALQQEKDLNISSTTCHLTKVLILYDFRGFLSCREEVRFILGLKVWILKVVLNVPSIRVHCLNDWNNTTRTPHDELLFYLTLLSQLLQEPAESPEEATLKELLQEHTAKSTDQVTNRVSSSQIRLPMGEIT